MTDESYDRFSDPRWIGFHREMDLAVELICDGANAVGQADYTKKGQYSLAMFGFSNGFERLGKVIVAADHYLRENSSPTDRELRNAGHHIAEILQTVEEIANRHSIEPNYPRPTDCISGTIIATLDGFAAAQRGRYANFNSIAGTLSPHDPITLWWNQVCEPILLEHFHGTKAEEQAQERARQVAIMMNGLAAVLYTHENGDLVRDPYRASLMTAERKITQKFGRFYTLSIARWMGSVFTELTMLPGYSNAPYLSGHYELAHTLTVPDEFLRNRKKWPLT